MNHLQTLIHKYETLFFYFFGSFDFLGPQCPVTTERWHCILIPGIAVHVFCQDAGARMYSLGQRWTWVNWFVRANELSPVNQALIGYPGMGNLVRELELNVRHTWPTEKAGTTSGSRVKRRVSPFKSVRPKKMFFLQTISSALLK